MSSYSYTCVLILLIIQTLGLLVDTDVYESETVDNVVGGRTSPPPRHTYLQPWGRHAQPSPTLTLLLSHVSEQELQKICHLCHLSRCQGATLLHQAFFFVCMRSWATSVCILKLPVYADLNYYCMTAVSLARWRVMTHVSYVRASAPVPFRSSICFAILVVRRHKNVGVKTFFRRKANHIFLFEIANDIFISSKMN